MLHKLECLDLVPRTHNNLKLINDAHMMVIIDKELARLKINTAYLIKTYLSDSDTIRVHLHLLLAEPVSEQVKSV